MSTIAAVFMPSPDGTLHLPVPATWQKSLIRVKAELEQVPTEPNSSLKGFGCLRGKIAMTEDFDAPLEDFKDYL